MREKEYNSYEQKYYRRVCHCVSCNPYEILLLNNVEENINHVEGKIFLMEVQLLKDSEKL